MCLRWHYNGTQAGWEFLLLLTNVADAGRGNNAAGVVRATWGGWGWHVVQSAILYCKDKLFEVRCGHERCAWRVETKDADAGKNRKGDKVCPKRRPARIVATRMPARRALLAAVQCSLPRDSTTSATHFSLFYQNVVRIAGIAIKTYCSNSTQIHCRHCPHLIIIFSYFFKTFYSFPRLLFRSAPSSTRSHFSRNTSSTPSPALAPRPLHHRLLQAALFL